MARRDFRGTPPSKLLDAVIRPVLRGTTDRTSPLWRHDLLSDIYGAAEAPISIRARRVQFGVPTLPVPTYPSLNNTQLERPLLLGGRFLRIPIVLGSYAATNERPARDAYIQQMPPTPFNPVADLPMEHDAWTGRTLTFLQGPLQGQSFRIVRYMGNPRVAPSQSSGPPVAQLAQGFSVVIDLQEAAGGLVTSQNGAQTLTQSIEDWINLSPASLCYSSWTAGQFSTGYQMLINAVPFNSHGMGLTGNLANPSQAHTITPATLPADIQQIPVALQPRYGSLGISIAGDADESYDAADFQNFWMSHRQTGATASEQIIPSFHRPALVNYIVNWKDPASYADIGELVATVQRIEMAVARPLSIRIRNDSGAIVYVSNPNFTGSNASGASPQLDVMFTTNWGTDTNFGAPAFIEWARWLVTGNWDVDSDADGVYDGMWIDPNLPLITSREGKLLKTLVSYTIESLDSRIDANAAGNLVQTAANYVTSSGQSYAQGAGLHVSQGLGYGPAEISLRHLFGQPVANNAAYNTFLASRYSGQYYDSTGVRQSESVPGTAGVRGDDVRSQLNARERRNLHVHGQLPGMPMAVNGRTALGLDHMGNPLLLNSGATNLFGATFNQGLNEAYESRFIKGPFNDQAFSIAEWERIARIRDWDRSNLPRRLGNSALAAHSNSVTPASRHLRHTPLTVSRSTGQQSHSMFELVRDMYAYNPPMGAPTALTYAAYAELFPLEFHRAQGFNLNRVLGNGVDDDGDGNIDEPEEHLKNGLDDDNDSTIDEFDERRVDLASHKQRTISAVNGSAQQVAIAEDYVRGTPQLDLEFESLALNSIEQRTHYGQQSRQLLARHLYCLAMMVLPENLSVGNRPAAVTGPERAKLLAQWAVNAVDMRDADSAMTRFPYDPEPFTVGGSATETTSNLFWYPNRDNTDTPNGEVVWGMEQQDVVLTESLFTHDLRVKDTTDEANGSLLDATDPNADQDHDQYRIPEGSGFFELLCLRTTSTNGDGSAPGVSGSLYGAANANANTRRLLNLSAVTPPNAAGDIFPTYRILISEPHPIPDSNDPATSDTNSAYGLQAPAQAATRGNFSYQISSNRDLNGLMWDASQMNAPPTIDRVVLFTQPGVVPINSTTIPDLPTTLSLAEVQGRVFTNWSGNPVRLNGGQYLVVGPREVTYFGSRDEGPTNRFHRPSPHRIVLENAASGASGTTPSATNFWASMYRSDNTKVLNKRAAMRDCVSMIAAQDVPWNTNPATGPAPIDSIGLNVSAPYGNAYYMTPTEQLESMDPTPDASGPLATGADAYSNLLADAYYDYSGNGTSIALPDQPFDARTGALLSQGEGLWPYQSATGDPEPLPGTQENWCTAFFQRVADPERPWHAVFNPYITTDWIPIDLTVFSGEESIAPDDPDDMKFASRQKTGAMMDVSNGQYAALTNAGRSFLSYDTTLLSRSTPAASSSSYFDFQLPLDSDAQNGIPRPTANGTGMPTTGGTHFATLGYLNSTFGLMGETNGAVIAGYQGSPATMPATLFWPDRHFTNPLELSWVPVSAPGQMMQEFSAPQKTAVSQAHSSDTALSQYSYLLNFFQQVVAQDGTAGTSQLASASIFDLMETPSPWSDAEDFVTPGSIATGVYGNSVAQDAINEIFGPLNAPYNRISRFVEPGRVNINDVSEPNVWRGIMWNTMSAAERNDPAATTPFQQELNNSRRGYTPMAGILGTNFLHQDSPTQFAGVFKSSFEAGMVPSTRTANAIDTLARDVNGRVVSPANVTLLRANNPTPTGPLFGVIGNYPASINVKHPYLDYQHFSRLSNLTTTRSNVFAVRATIGFFEFDPSSGPTGQPIGLGREYGADEGTVMRHRGFYVIDRSIPVGYQEGQDLNTDKCIILRRVIE